MMEYIDFEFTNDFYYVVLNNKIYALTNKQQLETKLKEGYKKITAKKAEKEAENKMVIVM